MLDSNKDHQLALLGHAIKDERVISALQQLEVGSELFHLSVDGPHVYDALLGFREKFHRNPTQAELGSMLGDDIAKIVKARNAALAAAIQLSTEIGFDVLLPSLQAWKCSQLVDALGEKVGQLRSRQDCTALAAAVQEAAAAISNVTATGAVTDTCDSAEWSLRERARREALVGKVTPTGIAFLDDAIGGIEPGNLVLVTSKTSVGKSQLLLRMAIGAAKSKKVFLLALEAYPGEAQARIKWPFFLAAYGKDNPGQVLDLDGRAWSQGEYAATTKNYEDAAHEQVVTLLANVQTRYKVGARYPVEHLERDVLAAVKEGAELVLIDHLQFVDSDNKNIWEGQKEVMERIHSLAKATGVGIVVAAHIRKQESKRFRTLIPDTDDLMGSSDIAKIAPTIIALAPTAGLDDKALPLDQLKRAGLVPTLVAVTKMRAIGGGAARTQFAAVCHFSPQMGQYIQDYDLGKLRGGDTRWEPVYEDELPRWARRATRRKFASNVA